MPNDYDRIPEELRWDNNWCLAGPADNGEYKAPHGFNSHGIFHASPTQSSHWRDLESTIEASQTYAPCGIGFMLTAKNSLTCIDLDIKNENNESDPSKWTSAEQIERHYAIIRAFDSYTERSSSGQGYHIWVHGNIGAGCKRDGVEVYSQERFIVCTGDVVVNKSIEARQELLELLIGEIKNVSKARVELIELAELECDEIIFKRARDASNSEKFIQLCLGDWASYPSQSEADLALLSIFAFYSKSNTQCRRMFRSTKLGERPKATRNDTHLNRTLRVIRERESVEEDIVNSTKQIAAELVIKIRAQAAQSSLQHAQNERMGATLTVSANALQPQPHNQAQTQPHNYADYPPDYHLLPSNLKFDDETDNNFNSVVNTQHTPLDWPPGFVGEVARYIFDISPRPVREVSIVSALGLFAGICGRAFNIPQSGLNLYIVLIARSAIGKEAMHSGISSIINTIMESVPTAMKFVDFTDYASGPGLSKAISANTSFVNVSGEWGRKLSRLAQEDGRDGPMQQLRTVMTNLYQKSGTKSIVGGVGYSDKEKNVASVSGVAYSMIGETTPDTFYQSLTDSMMADGFLSRFTIIEYDGERPAANHTSWREIDQLSKDHLSAITDQALNLNNKNAIELVGRNKEAAEILTAFDIECDTKINMNTDEGFRQMWNRAHLKAYRISALLAVADNHLAPVITKKHIDWALIVVRKDIAMMNKRMDSGDVGSGDQPRQKKILSILEKYLKQAPALSYGVQDNMYKAHVIPRKYLQIQIQKTSSFTSHRNGQNVALDATLKSLCDSGYIIEISKDSAFKDFNFHGRCFRILNLSY